MKKSKSILLTDNELLFTIIGSIMGVSILSLPNAAVSVAKQDGWISPILGSIYPLYVIFMASIILKKFPNSSIMDISKKYLGKIFGNLLNFLFMAQFLYYAIAVIGADIFLLIVYAVWFLSPFKIALVFVLLVVYVSRKGLKVLSRINVIAFFGFCLVMLVTLNSLRYGSLLNLQPVLGSGFSKIAKAGINTAFSFANMELILVINPFVKNKDKIIKIALVSTAIITFFYILSVFTATFLWVLISYRKAFGPSILLLKACEYLWLTTLGL